MSQGVNNVRKNIPLMWDDETTQLSNAFKVVLAQLQEQLKSLDNCIDSLVKRLLNPLQATYLSTTPNDTGSWNNDR